MVRAVIEVDLCAGGSALVTVSQGLSKFEDTLASDGRLTYDLAP